MKLGLFSVRDEKAGAFLPPFVLPNQDMAVREFSNCANDPGHAFGRNPADYALYRVALFDDLTGQMECFEKPEYVTLAALVKRVPRSIDIAEVRPGELLTNMEGSN